MIGARFTRPVFLGETLRKQWWLGENGLLEFCCVSVERSVVVLDLGQAQIAVA